MFAKSLGAALALALVALPAAAVDKWTASASLDTFKMEVRDILPDDGIAPAVYQWNPQNRYSEVVLAAYPSNAWVKHAGAETLIYFSKQTPGFTYDAFVSPDVLESSIVAVDADQPHRYQLVARLGNPFVGDVGSNPAVYSVGPGTEVTFTARASLSLSDLPHCHGTFDCNMSANASISTYLWQDPHSPTPLYRDWDTAYIWSAAGSDAETFTDILRVTYRNPSAETQFLSVTYGVGVTIDPVPEPSAVALLLSGIGAAAVWGRRRAIKA